jgi:hypothetical protein
LLRQQSKAILQYDRHGHQIRIGKSLFGLGITLPAWPLWPGFAFNTVLYAGVLWMLCCSPFALRRMIRRRRGQCVKCAYPIG